MFLTFCFQTVAHPRHFLYIHTADFKCTAQQKSASLEDLD